MLKKVFEEVVIQDPESILDTKKYTHDVFIQNIKDSYAVILASISEVSPNIIMQAIQYSKPFILTRENGIINRVGEYAVLINPKDKEDIKEKILWLSDPLNYEKQCKKIKSFNFTHSYNDIAKEILNVYLNLNLMNKI